jgi:hypothetical protein
MSAVVDAPADHAARQLVSVDGLHRTLFVEAGAGTGKTTQLVDRITNLVLTHDVRLVNIAAITFTEAAAAELQTRRRVAFEKRSATTDDAVEAERAQRALADIDLAALSTLHGFASRLLGEFAVEAGLPPRVQVRDEVSSQLAHEDRWSRFVDELYDEPEHEPLLIRAALLQIAFEPQYQGHATLKDVAFELNSNWDRLTDLASDPLPPLGPVDFRPFDDAVAALVALPDDCSDPDDLFCVHLREVLLPELRAVVSIPDPDRKLAYLAGGPEWKTGRGGKAGAWGGDVKGAKAKVADVNEAADVVVRAAADVVLRPLLALLSREVLAAAVARRR